MPSLVGSEMCIRDSPSTAPPSDTINMWTTHSNILYPTSSPPIAISYSKIPYPYGIYHTPYFVASTSAPELCQPHQTLALTPPVLCPREPRPGGEPCMYSYICEISVRFGTYLFIRALLAKTLTLRRHRKAVGNLWSRFELDPSTVARVAGSRRFFPAGSG